MQIFFRSLDGKTFTIDVMQSDTIEKVKRLIQSKTDIPYDKQVLYFGGDAIKNDKTLKDYNIITSDTLHLMLRLRGGGGSFTDVSQGHMLHGNMSNDAPDWRVVSSGLILCGICKNISCEACNKNILIRQKFIENYELIHAREPCPICGQKVEITNCGFFNCQWKYYGSLEDGTIKDATWTQTAPNACEFFDEDKCGKVRWNSLVISTRNNDENSIKIID